jgi:hypothetical protein
MNPDTLVAVSAYAGDKNQVEHNLPVYIHHECPVLILSPEDAPITEVSHPLVVCRSAGLKGWIGPQTLERQRKFLEILLEYPFGHFLFNDADSMCLSPEIPKYLYESPDTIWSNEVVDTNPAPSFLPKIALQPPYFLSRKSIEGMLKCVNNLPISYYGEPQSPEGWPLPFPTECIDHWMLQVAHGSGFPHMNFFTGASFETKSKHGITIMSDLVRGHGKVLIHSVKTADVINRLRMDHEIWKTLHTPL